MKIWNISLYFSASDRLVGFHQIHNESNSYILLSTMNILHITLFSNMNIYLSLQFQSLLYLSSLSNLTHWETHSVLNSDFSPINQHQLHLSQKLLLRLFILAPKQIIQFIKIVKIANLSKHALPFILSLLCSYCALGTESPESPCPSGPSTLLHQPAFIAISPLLFRLSRSPGYSNSQKQLGMLTMFNLPTYKITHIRRTSFRLYKVLGQQGIIRRIYFMRV